LSSAQCLSLLKALATGGRTVICVIHTPSARLFHMIDNVYIVAEGQCAFQGNGQQVIPFLEMSCGLSCPKTYNPADFGELFLAIVWEKQSREKGILSIYIYAYCIEVLKKIKSILK